MNLWIFGRGIFSMKDEPQVIFEDFIGLYKGFFSDENIEDFFEYWNFAERVSPDSIQTRSQTEQAHLFHKADSQLGLNTIRVNPDFKKLNSDFDDFLRHLNGHLLELYNNRYPGFGRPVAIEGKMQKTEPSQGYHVWHCELDPEVPHRVLAWSLFLNDVEEGGELEFLHQNKRYKPKKGDFIIWPAAFTHIHRGNPPISNVKYIVTGWYQYVNPTHLTND